MYYYCFSLIFCILLQILIIKNNVEINTLVCVILFPFLYVIILLEITIRKVKSDTNYKRYKNKKNKKCGKEKRKKRKKGKYIKK